MWALVIALLFLGILFILTLVAWCVMIGEARQRDPLCLRCRGRMVFDHSKPTGGFPFSCRRCEPFDRRGEGDKAIGWAMSKLRRPE